MRSLKFSDTYNIIAGLIFLDQRPIKCPSLRGFWCRGGWGSLPENASLDRNALLIYMQWLLHTIQQNKYLLQALATHWPFSKIKMTTLPAISDILTILLLFLISWLFEGKVQKEFASHKIWIHFKPRDLNIYLDSSIPSACKWFVSKLKHCHQFSLYQ